MRKWLENFVRRIVKEEMRNRVAALEAVEAAMRERRLAIPTDSHDPSIMPRRGVITTTEPISTTFIPTHQPRRFDVEIRDE
jgi:hypothetical protein